MTATFVRTHAGVVHILRCADRALCGARVWPDCQETSDTGKICGGCLRTKEWAKHPKRGKG